MIKVIRKGKPKPKLHGTCSACKATVECDDDDATHLQDCPADPGAWGVKCPECKMQWIYLK